MLDCSKKVTQHMTYCQALLPRAGLGNRLFPWARCRIFSHMNKIPMIAPVWPQLAIGPILRGEMDLRFYHNLFKNNPADIGGIRGMFLTLLAQKIPEPQDYNYVPGKSLSRPSVIVFKGLSSYFKKINGWDEFILKEIRTITRKKWLQISDRAPLIYIGINVRCGDFKEPKSPEDFFTTGMLRTPLSWFIDCLKIIRYAVGSKIKAFVVSDASTEELKDLLSQNNIIFFDEGTAIAKLLFLAKASILIASGGSTFSAWASFLGQMPTISHPGQSLAWFNLVNRKGFYVGEFNPENPSDIFITQIKKLFPYTG